MTVVACEEMRNLRVTCFASGGDGRLFMTARLRKYFTLHVLTEPSQSSWKPTARFRITRSDVSHRRSHARSHVTEFRDSGRPGLSGSHDTPPRAAGFHDRKPALWKRRQLLGDPRLRRAGPLLRRSYRCGANRAA